VGQGEIGILPNYPFMGFDGFLPIAFFQVRVRFSVANGLDLGRMSPKARNGASSGERKEKQQDNDTFSVHFEAHIKLIPIV
jgi:hypothetical protein